MIKEIKYIKINEILSRVTRHPMLKDTTLEEVIQYVIDFMGILGLPKFFEDREARVKINEYRGVLPCDYVSINQVKDWSTRTCLRHMSDTFMPSDENYPKELKFEGAFKTQGNVIFTSFKKGDLLVSYKAIPVDENGYPLLIDDSNFLDALELFIKQKKFTMLFDMGQVNATVMKNTQQEYDWAVSRLQSKFTIPSTSEMETITRMWGTLFNNRTRFDNGFKDFNREYIRQH